MKKSSRDVANAHRVTQEQQKVEHDKAWADPYGEKTPTHNNKWVLVYFINTFHIDAIL